MIQLSMKLVYIQLLVLLSFITPFKFFYVPSVAVFEYFYSTARENIEGWQIRLGTLLPGHINVHSNVAQP